MTLFEEICYESQLLNEGVSNTKINSAINGMHPVTIVYDDQKGGGGKEWRLIYPVAYGTTKAGKPVIRAYQVSGSSKRGITNPPNNRQYPQWKFFLTDRIKSWSMDKTETFDGDNLTAFNENGDDLMSVVYNIAPIGNARRILSRRRKQEKDTANNNQPEIGYEPITKADVEGIELPKQQENQPKRKYTGKEIIDNILNSIYNSKPAQGIKNVVNKVKNTFSKNKENQPNQQNNVDNKENETDIERNNLLTAPETEPVTKNDISGVNDSSDKSTNANITQPKDEPISKNDINNVQDNELSKSYKDLTERMNNL